jgi:antitoxin VapB
MPLNIRDEAVNQLAEKLASAARVNKTEAVRLALTNELARREKSREAFYAAVKELQDRLAAYPDTGLKADKEFYDSLYDEP